MEGRVTILPCQASRIAQETARTGAAVAVSQSGSVLTLDTGRDTFSINAGGSNLPHTNQEQMAC